MPVEATDIDQPFDDAPSAEPQDAPEPQNAPEPQDAPKRGRPAGSKDKQPRKRPVRAVSLERPVTRRSAPPRKATRRVQIVESASEASESASEVETPRTARHRQWVEHRKHKQDMHQANVNRYAALFDRMLA